MKPARNQPEQLGRDFRGNAAKAAVAMGGVLRLSAALTADIMYYRFSPEDFAMVLTTRYNQETCNQVVANVLGHHFLGHAPLLVTGGVHEVLCTREEQIAAIDWADRFLDEADKRYATPWRQRVMRAVYSSAEPT